LLSLSLAALLYRMRRARERAIAQGARRCSALVSTRRSFGCCACVARARLFALSSPPLLLSQCCRATGTPLGRRRTTPWRTRCECLSPMARFREELVLVRLWCVEARRASAGKRASESGGPPSATAGGGPPRPRTTAKSRSLSRPQLTHTRTHTHTQLDHSTYYSDPHNHLLVPKEKEPHTQREARGWKRETHPHSHSFKRRRDGRARHVQVGLRPRRARGPADRRGARDREVSEAERAARGWGGEEEEEAFFSSPSFAPACGSDAPRARSSLHH
jgi:hypothetical protein